MNTRAACLSSGTLDLCTSAHLCQQFDVCNLDMAERRVHMKSKALNILEPEQHRLGFQSSNPNLNLGKIPL